MESACSLEYKTVINELVQGMEKAKQLHSHLCSTSPSRAQDLLMQRILSSYEKALLILNPKEHTPPPSAAAVDSPISVVDGICRSEDLNNSFRDNQDYNASKKRKMQPTWMEQVKVNPENGLEGPADDGYSWRKYGQKDILGARYPRSYYRCTYRLVQNCWATKQVQRSDDDPTVFEITYKGTHTCNQSTNAPVVPPPVSQEKQELQQQSQALLKLKASLRVNTDTGNSETMPAHFSFPSTYELCDTDNHYISFSDLVGDGNLGAYSPLFLSPATSETNYFSPAPHHMVSFGGSQGYQHTESDIADIVSAHASTTNSPIGSMDFPIDPLELDPNFPFNTSGFFR
ncbi:probable WRKY transcription factor 41 [Salvia miltiorrhiza]|uniref:probable WRKY transcription factor 41 n=1 Tax=Salvia miltiorrhiza TaxID=226208 RepID=UPI0025ACB384|nr:probable WRKY transcription factor 41 [Salvia miltiorrhiza]